MLSAGIIFAHFRGHTLIPGTWTAALLAAFWCVNFSIILSIVFGFNKRLADPSMSLPQMYWASLTASTALLFVTQLDAFIYLLILLPMVFGIFRVPIKPFQYYTVVVIFSLFFVYVARSLTANTDTLSGLAAWLSFSFFALTLSTLCKSAIRLQDKLRAKNDLLEQAAQAKADFLANMSHEIRTPLSGVLGLLDLTLSKEINDSVNHDLRIAKESGETLLTIINDILDFSKIEAGKLELAPTTFELKAFLEGVLTQFEAVATQKNIALSQQYDSNIPLYICADSNRLRQILNNLIGNATKFTQNGRIQLISQVSETGQDDGNTITLDFIVVDSGIGIPAQRLHSLFEHFSQADATTTRLYGGTGLGLAIARSLCQLMGGEIFACSELGKGSTFKFSIDAVIPKQAPPEATKPIMGDIKALKNTRILLVEDNPTNQYVAQAMLEKLSTVVTIANDGEEALRLLRVEGSNQLNYDLIFMDCQMPNLDGYETTRIIRKNNDYTRYSKIPIIAMTANAMEGDREICIASGMDDYTVKPINIPLLSQILSKHLPTKEVEPSVLH